MVTFLIVIVAFIIIKFLYDSFQQSNKIKSEGGIRLKYSKIVDHFLSADPRSRVFQETNTFVSVGISGAAGSQIYYITPAYGNVAIRMEIINNPLLGNQKMEWTFPENMDQDLMIEKINTDIANKMSSLMSRYQ